MLIKTDLQNIADDNTITVVCNQLADLIKILEAERRTLSGMVPEKFR